MSKKVKSKSKPVSKKKAPKSSSSSKKSVKKTAKPAAKKSPAKKIVKAKISAKKPAKVNHKAKAKVVAKKTAKPEVKSKAVAKPASKIPVNSKAKMPVDKSKQNVKAVTHPAKPAETKTEPSKNMTNQNRPSVARPIPVNRRPEPARAIISNSKPEKETGKNRYSDNELDEFREIINKKLENARRELTNLQAQMHAANEHGTDDTASTFKILEDGSDSLAKEEAGQLASRQKKFIEQLENALVRIENKTYGICRVTGKLIPKERLRAVPHTTQSIEAKLNQYRD